MYFLRIYTKKMTKKLRGGAKLWTASQDNKKQDVCVCVCVCVRDKTNVT